MPWTSHVATCSGLAAAPVASHHETVWENELTNRTRCKSAGMSAAAGAGAGRFWGILWRPSGFLMRCELSLTPTKSNGTVSEVAKSNSTSSKTFAESNGTASEVASNTNSDSSSFTELRKLSLAPMAAGDTATYVAVDGKPAGVVALSDTIRREARRTVKTLNAAGAEPVLLTGDTQAAAQTVANLAGISEVVASCKPEDKMAYIQKSEADGVPCAMIGDGINDAPALRRAYTGIAVGGVGADVAVEAADIAIANGSISKVPHLVALSRHMMRVIKANLTFSMTLNFVAIVLAFIAVLDPVSGALVHNCGSVFMIVNSAFLLSWPKR